MKKETIIKILIILGIIYSLYLISISFGFSSGGGFISLPSPSYDFLSNTFFGLLLLGGIIYFKSFKNKYSKNKQILIFIFLPILVTIGYYIYAHINGEYKMSLSIFNKFDKNGIVREEYLDYYDEYCRGGYIEKKYILINLTCFDYFEQLRNDSNLIIKTFEGAKSINSKRLYNKAFNSARGYGFDKISSFYYDDTYFAYLLVYGLGNRYIDIEDIDKYIKNKEILKISKIYIEDGNDKYEKMKEELLKIPTINKKIIE